MLLLLALVAAAAFAVYWLLLRGRYSGTSRSRSFFTIPVDRVKKSVLDNGMHVVVFQNPSLPKVLVQIAYDVGSYVEENGERGLAHLVEHMIYKGTNTLSETDIHSIARKYGAHFNAFTALDVTSYYFETDKNNWKPFLPLLADCMQNARFDPDHLASEIKAVIQELKMYKDDYWRTMILKACELTFPPNHPYHTPTIGFKEDLLSLKPENLKNFYKKYYRPDRATLFIVGDVDLDDAIAQANKNFASITADQSSVVKPFPIIIPELVTNHTRYFEDVTKEQLGFYWVIPGLKASNEYVVSAIETLLGGGQSGRLYRLLVDEQRVASSVYVKAAKFMEAGIFLVLIEPMPGKSELCSDLVKRELERIGREGVSIDELDMVAKKKSRQFFQKTQSFTDFVYCWIKSYFATHDGLNIFKRVNSYYQIMPSDVQMFVKDNLDPFLMNRIEVLPLPENKKPLRERLKLMSDGLDKKILARYVRKTPVEAPKVAPTYPAPQPLTFVFPKPARVLELPNGLRVILAPNHYTPLIAVNCRFKEARYLDDAREGISVEMMMDMLMEGSKGYSKRDNVDFFEHHGASYAFDSAGARFVCLKDDVDVLLGRFMHIVTKPTFPPDALEKLKKIFVNSYQRAKDSPKAMALRLLRNEIYRNHPFAWTFDEAITLVQALQQAQLFKLHAAYLYPANMVVSVVGDFDADHMAQELRQQFGAWPKGAAQTVVRTARVSSKGKSIDYNMLRDQVFLLLAQPSPVTVYDPDWVPLNMLSIIGFRSLGSRIYQLREQTGLFYSAFGAFASNAVKDPGYDIVGMIVSPENVSVAEQRIRAQLKQFADDGVTETELAAARRIYLKDLIELVSDDSAIARMMASLDALELGFDYYDRVLERVQDMDVVQLNQLLQKYCTPDEMIRVRVGPMNKVK